jgi:hypothetical protein
MIDFTVQAERSITLAVRQVYADTALLLASPCDWARMRQEPGQVLWSWVEIRAPSPGHLVFLQPIGLAREIARCVQDVDTVTGEPAHSIQVQRTLTTRIAQHVLNDLTQGARPLAIDPPASGEGAPDIQEGHWVGRSFLVNGWWSAVFLRCPGLLLDSIKPPREETRALRPSEDAQDIADQPNALEAKPVLRSAPVAGIARSTAARGATVAPALPVAAVARNASWRSALNRSAVLAGNQSDGRQVPQALTSGTGAHQRNRHGHGEVPLPSEIGHYQILEQLGSGGMGMVLKARHRLLDRVVALKVMRPELAASHEFSMRFIALARQAAGLEHPHVVTVYDAANEHGHLYMVVRYFAAGDLPQRLRQHGVMTALQAVDFFSDCLSGLAFMHGKGLVHGNIGPSNILVQDDGRPCIADFGMVGVNEMPGGSGFTASHQSHAPVAQRADLYALGATLYYALTNRHPFPGTSLSANTAQARAGLPDEARLLAPIVAIALCDDEQVAYTTAQAFRDALQQSRRLLPEAP